MVDKVDVAVGLGQIDSHGRFLDDTGGECTKRSGSPELFQYSYPNVSVC